MIRQAVGLFFILCSRMQYLHSSLVCLGFSCMCVCGGNAPERHEWDLDARLAKRGTWVQLLFLWSWSFANGPSSSHNTSALIGAFPLGFTGHQCLGNTVVTVRAFKPQSCWHGDEQRWKSFSQVYFLCCSICWFVARSHLIIITQICFYICAVSRL